MSRLSKFIQAAALFASASLPTLGQETSSNTEPDLLLDAGNAVLEPMTVIGSKEDTVELQGSGYYVDSEEIRTQNYSNVNRILAKVPECMYERKTVQETFLTSPCVVLTEHVLRKLP